MKSYFRHRPVNEPFEDPCLFVGIARQKRALLLDAGDLHRLSQTELYKVSDLFVTHMHIDHFIGFDTLLRAILRRPVPLRVYGPEGIVDAIDGKLRGYTWNLIRSYPLKIEVFEISGGTMYGLIRHCSFHAENGLKPVDRGYNEFNGYVLKEPFFSIKALSISHGIPVLAYRIDEEIHINIDKAKLTDRNIETGPWLSEFKEAILKNDRDRYFRAGNKTISFKEIEDIALLTEGQKISYVMDVSIESENIERIVDFVRGSDYLYCEAFFLERDLELASERNHLTARLAGEIARRAGVRNLIPMHFSLRYKDQPEIIIEEAMKAFSGKD
ncbi:MAG: ribonuclease Z [Thermodesulfovibrionales bacterium]